jgi:microcystin degradation protein MlrC
VLRQSRRRICAPLSLALDEAPLDGVYLDLHGAAVVVSFPDAEGELLRRVRAIVGAVPIAISLDPHANMTALMVELADVMVPFRTYPHVDTRAAGARAMHLLIERIRHGKPWARAFRQLDYWIPLPSQCTLVGPMQAAMAEREAIATRTDMVELAFCFGFPYADFPDCGVAIAAYATDAARAQEAADAFHDYLAAHEAMFRLEIVPADAAVADAIAIAATATRPVVIADTQDNPGGGGHGDTTGLLAELIRQGARGAVLALINDAESATSIHAAGEGAKVALSLGGKSDGVPLVLTATVLRATDGRFTNTGPMTRGNPNDLGPCALIEVAPGIRVIVVSRKTQAYDQALFRHVGIEPSECGIIVLKSSVHFRADFQPIAETVIVAAAPGPVAADPATLDFLNLRPGLRKRPMDNRGVAA